MRMYVRTVRTHVRMHNTHVCTRSVRTHGYMYVRICARICERTVNVRMRTYIRTHTVRIVHIVRTYSTHNAHRVRTNVRMPVRTHVRTSAYAPRSLTLSQ